MEMLNSGARPFRPSLTRPRIRDIYRAIVLSVVVKVYFSHTAPFITALKISEY